VGKSAAGLLGLTCRVRKRGLMHLMVLARQWDVREGTPLWFAPYLNRRFVIGRTFEEASARRSQR